MQLRTVLVRWRVAFSGLLSLTLITLASLGAAEAHPTRADSAKSQPVIAKPATHSVARLKDIVDLSTLPTITPGSVSTGVAIKDPLPDRLTLQQRAA